MLSDKRSCPELGRRSAVKNMARFGELLKKKVWQNTSDDPETGNPRLMPAIYLTYWKIQKGERQGIGKMLGYSYTMHDNTFEANWEYVE